MFYFFLFFFGTVHSVLIVQTFSLVTGGVTQVKDQGVCGSCWSFGTVGTIEGAYFIKYGRRVRFSQQQLVDCSWGEGNNGCDGGEDFRYSLDDNLYYSETSLCDHLKVKTTLLL